jgi:hypothetical protein
VSQLKASEWVEHADAPRLFSKEGEEASKSAGTVQGGDVEPSHSGTMRVETDVPNSNLTKASGGIVRNKKLFKIDENFKTPFGNTITVARDGDVIVNVGKVNAYTRNKVRPSLNEVKTELRELREFKQQRRKDFDFDPNNEKRLKLVRDVLLHNAELSQEMSLTLERAGISDTVANNDLIVHELLQAGRHVTSNNTKVSTVLQGANGDVKIQDVFQVLPDGNKYLNTVNLFPVKPR